MPAPAKRKKSSVEAAGMSRRKMSAMRAMAEERGLLSGKTHVLRGRMPGPLISAAKKNTGITSDTELIKLALTTLALEDNYGEWLASQYGTIAADIDLEY
jgi:hypothetical protein